MVKVALVTTGTFYVQNSSQITTSSSITTLYFYSPIAIPVTEPRASALKGRMWM